jgi:hypothetical protein
MTIELLAFSGFALPGLLALLFWLRRPDASPLEHSAASSPFPLHRIALRVFDPADFSSAARITSKTVRADFRAERRRLSVQWCQRARVEINRWFAAHRAAAASSDTASLAAEGIAILALSRLHTTVFIVEVVAVLAGPQYVRSVVSGLEAAVALPQSQALSAVTDSGSR